MISPEVFFFPKGFRNLEVKVIPYIFDDAFDPTLAVAHIRTCMRKLALSLRGRSDFGVRGGVWGDSAICGNCENRPYVIKNENREPFPGSIRKGGSFSFDRCVCSRRLAK